MYEILTMNKLHSQNPSKQNKYMNIWNLNSWVAKRKKRFIEPSKQKLWCCVCVTTREDKSCTCVDIQSTSSQTCTDSRSFAHISASLCSRIEDLENRYDLTLRKIAIWLSKNCQKLDIFLKKMKIFVNSFEKNVKILAIFWHSNGNFPEGQVVLQFGTKCDKSVSFLESV